MSDPAFPAQLVFGERESGSNPSSPAAARVFEPFLTTKAVGKGSGLGLSQVYSLAKQSGGGVTIETTIGSGTTIRIFLPRAAADAQTETLSVAPISVTPHLGATILVVDDDGAVRAVTPGVLVDLGYRVIEAGSGGAAWISSISAPTSKPSSWISPCRV